MAIRHSIPWTTDPRLLNAGAAIGRASQRHGKDHPITGAARTEVRTIRATLAIEDLINSSPPPTPEQIRRLRLLLREGAA